MRKFSAVWNVTKYCVWNCPFCCVDAILCKNRLIPNNNELNLEDKKKIIDNIASRDIRLDLSGGELLINDENLELIKYASYKLGKENLGISISGAFINKEKAVFLKKLVNEVEITLDCVPDRPYALRPNGYHKSAANAIITLVNEEIPVGVQTVWVKDNISTEMINELYSWCIDNKVSEWSLLRFFPSGRGSKYAECEPTLEEYKSAISHVKKLQSKNSQLNIHLQYVMPTGEEIQCRAVSSSIGILPNGDCISCFWGIVKDTNMIGEEFVLGNLVEKKLDDILSTHKAICWKNNRHCKIFSSEI